MSLHCRCVGACDCFESEHDLYVVSEWEQHDRDTNRRGTTDPATHPSLNPPRQDHGLRLVIGHSAGGRRVDVTPAGRPPSDPPEAA